ncbi:hypothetical protein VOLCADRAFT_91995 [Volvox carteri f. nagariensis]|uniref:Uncharacterized protein n=1 Tax=Volvox carteri f. nagariensis TaxID=3068 RepID=D8TYH4_VOLCA|nr:uncharacterized protein VOLCADRAFT_91995 [Volvox carteri f. nagariensis]EFJ47642.1 hypothetical protein VOLCADRAFT_91995 [Volvox carteri f. nagariensis]|eukprot:XP_002951466.1 hypothetical protein VOLCADRAFT_91995 [Volvox carteri f. nagariensis]
MGTKHDKPSSLQGYADVHAQKLWAAFKGCKLKPDMSFRKYIEMLKDICSELRRTEGHRGWLPLTAGAIPANLGEVETNLMDLEVEIEASSLAEVQPAVLFAGKSNAEGARFTGGIDNENDSFSGRKLGHTIKECHRVGRDGGGGGNTYQLSIFMLELCDQPELTAVALEREHSTQVDAVELGGLQDLCSGAQMQHSSFYVMKP